MNYSHIIILIVMEYNLYVNALIHAYDRIFLSYFCIQFSFIDKTKWSGGQYQGEDNSRRIIL
jgi:hypothetical protein